MKVEQSIPNSSNYPEGFKARSPWATRTERVIYRLCPLISPRSCNRRPTAAVDALINGSMVEAQIGTRKRHIMDLSHEAAMSLCGGATRDFITSKARIALVKTALLEIIIWLRVEILYNLQSKGLHGHGEHTAARRLKFCISSQLHAPVSIYALPYTLNLSPQYRLIIPHMDLLISVRPDESWPGDGSCRASKHLHVTYSMIDE